MVRMTAEAGEEGKNGKMNFYPGHLDSKSTRLGSSPDGEVFQSTPKEVPTAYELHTHVHVWIRKCDN